MTKIVYFDTKKLHSTYYVIKKKVMFGKKIVDKNYEVAMAAMEKKEILDELKNLSIDTSAERKAYFI